MREIKFRVYDLKAKKFISDISNLWINPSFSAMMEWRSELDGNTVFELNESLIFQQYVGVVDKNGVEIYEGDIVSNRYIPEGFTVELVNFFDEEYGFISGFKLGGSPGLEDFRLFNSEHPVLNEEVIGNIFEGIKHA